MYLMHKDTPVLKIENGIKVLEKSLVPYVLKKDTIDYDDFYGNFLGYRALSISRSYAKELMQQLKLSQNNAMKICLAVHSVSYSDCYWTKDEEEDLTWQDVSLYQAPPDADIAKVAFNGVGQLYPMHRLHTPELTTQGVSAKCWNWYKGQSFLYKVSRKELAASEILDQLGFSHLSYQLPSEEEILAVTTQERRGQITEMGEMVVKCACMTTEDISLLAFEEFAVYCENNEMNPYEYIRGNYLEPYQQMILADYILGNSDRHIGNWGFLYHADTMQILGLHPLMDHDRAFSDQKLMTQTLEQEVMMEDAVKALPLGEDVQRKLRELRCPENLREEEWRGVRERIDHVLMPFAR